MNVSHHSIKFGVNNDLVLTFHHSMRNRQITCNYVWVQMRSLINQILSKLQPPAISFLFMT